VSSWTRPGIDAEVLNGADRRNVVGTDPERYAGVGLWASESGGRFISEIMQDIAIVTMEGE